MKQSTPPEPFSETELLKLITVTTLTAVSKLALKAKNEPQEIINAAVKSGYTLQGSYAALREAGHRMRRERCDKGQTLRVKLKKLIEQSQALEKKMTESARA
jgi:aspartate oxidase